MDCKIFSGVVVLKGIILAVLLFFVITSSFGMADISAIFEDFHLGIEISELLQRNFTNLGRDNYTFLFGQKFGKLGYRLLSINVQLSPEHIADNPYIVGDLTGAEAQLLAHRGYFDYYIFDAKLGFLDFIPIASFGLGYQNMMVAKEIDLYDFKAVTLSVGLRIQCKFFNIAFIEFPVGDLFFYLIKNRSAKGAFDSLIIDYPEWGLLFLWINVGIEL